MKDIIILHSTPLNELKSVFGEVVEEKLRQFKSELSKPTSTKEYLSRAEVCKVLKISLSTLHSYSKSGILQKYHVGGKILYKSAEVESSLI
jgi:hypothetical protein